MYKDIVELFHSFHRVENNVICHMITSFFGFVGFFGICKFFSLDKFINMTMILYTLSLKEELDNTVMCSTVSFFICSLFVSQYLRFKMNINKCVSLIIISYILQDISHIYFKEETYQKNTWGDLDNFDLDNFDLYLFTKLFYEHVYYLIPLCIECLSEKWKYTIISCPLIIIIYGNYKLSPMSSGTPFGVVRDKVVKGKITCKDEHVHIENIIKYVKKQDISSNNTYHWWTNDLIEIKKEIDSLLLEPIKAFKTIFSDDYEIEPVYEMNELYISVASNRKGTSDNVFVTPHIDGPWILFPFCSVYRGIIALTENKQITTHHQMLRKKTTAKTGDYLIWDFNRESHYVSANDCQNDFPRTIIKTHYIVYPKQLKLLGRICRFLTAKYDHLFRRLFLFTINPDSILNKLFTMIGVILTTVLYNSVEVYFGYNNILYCLYLYFLSHIHNNYGIFLYGTSFVHYIRYISTYFDRRQVHYGIFQRDVLFFKTLSIGQLFIMTLYDSPFINYKGYACVFIGYTVSILATHVLGKDKTYFGLELGIIEGNNERVSSFPYGYIPHPMITGQILSLLGFYTFQTISSNYYLIPIHIILYCIHLFQEIYDIFGYLPEKTIH